MIVLVLLITLMTTIGTGPNLRLIFIWIHSCIAYDGVFLERGRYMITSSVLCGIV
jgi:hypothetical protein